MSWIVPRIWEGEDAWIIGGGPSITKQFGIPENIVRKVRNNEESPSIYSPYMKAIHDKHIIAVNMAYHLGNWVDMMFFGDTGFFTREQEGLLKFAGLKVHCHPTHRHEPWLKYLVRDVNHPKGLSPTNGMVAWNGNSGAAAINLAVHTGAKRILLLGFDMKMDEQSNQHWHNEYHRGQITDDKKRRHLPFDRHLAYFPAIADDAKKMKIEIINICPDSAIPFFTKANLSEIL